MQHPTAILPAFNLRDLPPAQRVAVSYLAGYQGNTLNLYRYHLDQWMRYCDAGGLDPLDVERGDVQLWVHEFAKTHKASSVGAAFTPIKGYYRFAYLEGHMPRDPAAYIRLPKIVYKKRPPVDRTDIRRFLLTAKHTSPRHWCLTQMLGVMGMRISEACSITVEQALVVDRGMRVLHYIGKGNKPAMTPIPYSSVSAFDAAIGDRRTGWLISTLDGRQMERHGAAGLIATVNRRAGLDRNLNPHYLRALAITQGKEAGLSLDEMREFARHEDTRTTQRHYDLTQTEVGSHPVHAIGARLAI